MIDLRMKPEEMRFFVEALVECGAKVRLFQRTHGVPWELIVTPVEGTDPKDFAYIKDGELHIMMQEGSVLGIFKLIGIVVSSLSGYKERKKRFF